MDILNNIATSAENVAIVVVELLAPPVIDDIVEHQIHNIKKVFTKDFTNRASFNEFAQHFSSDVIKCIKKDIHLVKSICCFHPHHADKLKHFVQRSLIKNGFETATTAALVVVVASESLPVLVSAVIAQQLIERVEEKYEPQLKDKMNELRGKFFKKSNKNNLNV